MQNIIPPLIKNNNSNAEKKIFELFKLIKASPDTYLFHSVNLSEHEYKSWAEIDFLLVSPKGIIVFEIKGGRILRKNGIWEFIDRFDNIHKKSEGPDEQAKSAMYSLRKMLLKEFPFIKNTLFGWGVIFPDIEFIPNTIEIPNEIVSDYNNMNVMNFTKYINNVFDYWNNHQDNKVNMNKNQILDLVNFIRPNFDKIPKLKLSINDIEQEQYSLTENQYYVLDSVLSNNRIICTGGAGTGKTFLAIELAKRQSLLYKIIIVCKSELLKEFIKFQLSDNKKVSIYSIDELSKLNVNIKYDYLIVDEGQDLLNENDFKVLNSKLLNGLEKGNWCWFMDFNNQSGIECKIDRNIKNILESYNHTRIDLKRNCRNTEQIVLETELTTGANIGKSKITGKGISVIYNKIRSNEDAINTLIDSIKKFSNEVDFLSEIVILSPVTYSKSIASSLPFSVKQLSKENIFNNENNEVIFSSIKNYKGLENKIVIIVDLDQIISNEDKNSFIYVAMTRASAVLSIQISDEFKTYLENQNLINIKRLMRGTNG